MRAEVAAIALLVGCTGSGSEFVLEPTEDAPAVADYGMLDVIPADEWDKLGPQEAIDTYGIHDTIGPAEVGHLGGGTYRFVAPGGEVCIFVDPELVFWGQSIAPDQPEVNFAYSDNYNDDGDIDLFAGISAYYTGSPGVEMGDFYGVYTDSQGQQTTIAYNECLQTGYSGSGLVDSHAGRGTPEFCTFDTTQREGVEFTVAMQTFAVPLDDGKLDFVAAVVGAPCSGTGGIGLSSPTHECQYHGERFKRDDESDEEYAVTFGLEDAYCTNPQESALAAYCCEYDDDYPDLCGEPPDSAFCAQFEKEKKK